MSLNRLVARIAAVSALNNYNAAPWPTIAGPHVYDSKIEPVEDFSLDVAFPVCVVYTDYDRNGPWHHTFAENKSEERMVTFTFEILVAQISEDEDGYVMASPITDSELEMSLDIFEKQLWNALAADNLAADCFRKLCYKVNDVISRRGTTTDGGQKLAARQITYECVMSRDPATPIVPDNVSAFLTQLETVGEYKDRVQAIKDMYETNSGITDWDAMIRYMGWAETDAGLIGFERNPVTSSVSPPTITYTGPNP